MERLLQPVLLRAFAPANLLAGAFFSLSHQVGLAQLTSPQSADREQI
jgi:hypothetical protein